MKLAIIDAVAIEQAGEDLAAILDPFGGTVDERDIPTGDPLTLDPEADRPMTDEEFQEYDRWISHCEAEWIREHGMQPPF